MKPQGIPVTFVGHPMAADAATHATRRETRDLLKLKAATPVFALLPGSRLSEIEMHADLVLATAARIHEARDDARFLVPFVTRATRDAFETAMHRHGPRPAADHAAVRPRRRRAARRRRRHRRLRHGDARSGAGALPARHLLPRVGADRAHRRAQAAAALCRTAQRARRRVRRARIPAGRCARRDNLAQAALNLFDDTVTRRRLEALFAGFAARAVAPTPARLAADGGAGRTATGGCAHAERRRRRSGARTARRSGLRRRGDPRSGATHSRPARFEGAVRRAARTPRRRNPRAARSRGRWPSADVAEIDTLNILQATLLAMRRAVEALSVAPTEALIDGNRMSPHGLPGARDRQGRSRRCVDFRGVDPRQDGARRAAGRAGCAISAVWICAEQGLRHAGTPGRAGAPRAVPEHRRSFAPVAQMRLCKNICGHQHVTGGEQANDSLRAARPERLRRGRRRRRRGGGQTLTGLILDEDRTITFRLRAGHPDRPQGRAEGHGGRRHGHQVRRRHRQGGRADRGGRSTRTCTTSRPSAGSAHFAHMTMQNDIPGATAAKTAASACAITSSSCRSTTCRTRRARRSPTTSRATLAIPHPYGRLQFGADLDLHFRTLIGTGANPNVAAVVVIGIEEQWTKKRRRRHRPTGKPVAGLRHRAARRPRHDHARVEGRAGIRAVGERAAARRMPAERSVGIDQVRRVGHDVRLRRQSRPWATRSTSSTPRAARWCSARRPS